MSEPINEQVLDFQEPVKTITATEVTLSNSYMKIKQRFMHCLKIHNNR